MSPNTIQVGGYGVEVLQSIEYLGFTIDNKLSWRQHINDITTKCRTALHSFGRFISSSWDMTSKGASWIYKGAIKPPFILPLSCLAHMFENNGLSKHLNLFKE